MTKKIYLHYDSAALNGTITIPVTINESSNVSIVLDQFTVAFNTKTGDQKISSEFCLKTSGGRVLSTTKTYDLLELTEDSDDMFVTDSGIRSPPVVKTHISVATEPQVKRNTLESNEIKEFRSQVSKCLEKRQYKTARGVCERMFTESIPDSDAVYFYRAMAEINFINKDYSKCLSFCKQGLVRNNKSADLLFLKAKALYAMKEYDDVIDITDILKDIVPKSVVKPVTASSISAASKDKKAVPSPIPKSVTLLDVLVLEAEAVFEGGNHNNGANLINKAMSYPGADNYLPVLLAYANFCLRYNKLEDAIRGLMKGITVSQSDRRLKQLLYEALKTPQGVEELARQLPCNAASASAYGFMATIVKDHSALNSAIMIYRMCLNAEPTSGSYALNLIHTIEITIRYDEAIDVFMSFARANASTRFNRVIPMMTAVLDVLDRAATVAAAAKKAKTSASGVSGASSPSSSASTSSLPEMEMTYVVDTRNDTHSHVRVTPVTLSTDSVGEDEVLDLTSGVDTKIDVNNIDHLKYTEQELDIIAMCCTVVKLVYLQGRLSLLPHIFAVMEPWRVRSEVPFHETLIRNEIAYYSTIAQKLCFAGGNDHVVLRDPAFPPAPKTPPSEKPFYLVGDSHCLSPGWMTVNVKGTPRLIVPKLSTGTKQWHLRDGADFYPKANFHNVINTIPDGAEVIMCIGEIDCREGMLVAVDRDYYASIPEAMEVTIRLFVKDVLGPLIARKKFKMYIHPIVPVLDPTRHLVIAYNNIFKDACAKMPGVVWLDFFDSLLNKVFVPPMLKERYKMDGTHLNPAYVELIEQALNDV